MFGLRTIVLLFLILILQLVSMDKTVWPDIVMRVAELYFKKDSQILLLDGLSVKETRTSLWNEEHTDAFDETLKRLQWAINWTIILANEDYVRPGSHFIHNRIPRVKTKYIVGFVDTDDVYDDSSIKIIVSAWLQNAQWYGQAKMLILVEQRSLNIVSTAHHIIATIWLLCKAANVVVFVSNTTGGSFLTSHPYTGDCGVNPVILTHWNKGSSINADLFPRKVHRNLQQCELSATTLPIPPLCFPPNAAGSYSEGLEIRLLEALSRGLNFSISYKSGKPGESPFLAMVNGVPSGSLGMVHRLEVDFAFHGLKMDWQRFQLADPLPAHYADEFIWIVPRPQARPDWLMVLVVFGTDSWLLIVLSLILSSLMYKVTLMTLQSSQTANNPFWDFAAALLYNSTSLHIKMSSLRLFFSIFLLYVITLTSIYSSLLFNIMTKGLHGVLFETPHEASLAGLTVFMYPSAALSVQGTLPKFYEYVTKKNLTNFAESHVIAFRRAALQKDMFCLFTGLISEYEIRTKFTSLAGIRYLNRLPERFSPFSTVFFMSKDHPLWGLFEWRMSTLIEGGWPNYIVRDIMAVADRHRKDTSEVLELSSHEERKKLTLSKIIGAFYIYFFFLFLSLLAFLSEILRHKIKAKRKRKKVTWLH